MTVQVMVPVVRNLLATGRMTAGGCAFTAAAFAIALVGGSIAAGLAQADAAIAAAALVAAIILAALPPCRRHSPRLTMQGTELRPTAGDGKDSSHLSLWMEMT
jgi:hypothetical protein